MGKRGKPCTICMSDKRHVVEVGLVNGMSYAALGERYKLSADAIGRHAREHLTPHVRAAIMAAQVPAEVDLETLRTNESEGLLGHLVAQRARLVQVATLALEAGDVRSMVAAESAIGANLALGAKMLGQLAPTRHLHESVLLTPDYLKLRAVLLRVLRAFPEAAKAVGQELALIESDAAKEIGGPPKVVQHQPAVIPPPPC